MRSLNDAGTDYMFTGALAASYYGTPRTTMDADIVVKVSSHDVQKLLIAPLKSAEMQVDQRRINEAFKSGFKIITLRDKRTSFTLDVILYEKKLVKKAGTIMGLPTFYQIPEDLVLSKLRMIKAMIPKERALKDKDDVRAILRHSKPSLRTLKKRAREENTLAILEELTSLREP